MPCPGSSYQLLLQLDPQVVLTTARVGCRSMNIYDATILPERVAGVVHKPVLVMLVNQAQQPLHNPGKHVHSTS